MDHRIGTGMGTMNGVTSNSLRMMEKSMDYLWAKQAAHLDNVANAETPGYKVKTVSFEKKFERKLQEAERKGHSRLQTRRAIDDADWEVEEDDEVTRYDENGVNVMEQSLEAVRTAYQLQYTMRAISSDLSTLGAAIRG